MKKVMTVIVATALAMTSVQAMANSREAMEAMFQDTIQYGIEYQKKLQNQHYQQLELALMREARAPYTPPKYYKTNYSNTNSNTTKQKTVTQKQQNKKIQ